MVILGRSWSEFYLLLIKSSNVRSIEARIRSIASVIKPQLATLLVSPPCSFYTATLFPPFLLFSSPIMSACWSTELRATLSTPLLVKIGYYKIYVYISPHITLEFHITFLGHTLYTITPLRLSNRKEIISFNFNFTVKTTSFFSS